MHVLYACVYALLFVCGAISQQTQSPETVNIQNKTDRSSKGGNCSTAKNVHGTCVDRELCDYGPNAIDFTLYAPRGFKTPCSSSEVCCPFVYIVVQSESARIESEGYDFDDDNY